MNFNKVELRKLLPLLVISIFLLFDLAGLAQEILPPTCYSGKRLLKEFIDEEMIYPDRAMQAGIEGTVELSFAVHADSTVSDLKVLRRVSPEIDREAIRLFRFILWYPATKLGKPIDYIHTIEINFKIKKYLKQTKARGYETYVRPYEPCDTSYKVYRRSQCDQWPKPIFTSLEKDLTNFLSTNLVYPETAFKQNVSGTVRLRFVVETSGRISNIQVLEPIGAGCTEEAIRVLRLIRWHPGLKNNLAVRTYMPLNITFNISKKTIGGTIPNPGQVQ